MKKKLILGLVAAVVVVGGVAGMSAYEAHVINVTAHIENALNVSPKEIAFGTVFPQEYVEDNFTISLSDSFLAEGRVDDVAYVINQKPKPIWDDENGGVPAKCLSGAQNIDAARAYCHDTPQDLDCCYLSLCPFLSKTDGDPEDNNDTSHLSYYIDPTPNDPNSGDEFCDEPGINAEGVLAKSENDGSDTWIVDLKVPPVSGFVGQDWPASCADWVVAQDSQDYGCDLWIEVIDISTVNPGLTNGGFEGTGTCSLDGWTIEKEVDSVTPLNTDSYSTWDVNPTEGSCMVRLGTPGVSGQPIGDNTISQVFKVTGDNLSFDYNLFTHDYEGFDKFEYRVKVATLGGAVVYEYTTGAWGTSGDTSLKTTGWKTINTIDVSSYAEQALKIEITAGGTLDNILNFWAYIDNVQN